MHRIALIADTGNTRAAAAASDLAERYTFVPEAAADVPPQPLPARRSHATDRPGPTHQPAPHPAARHTRTRAGHHSTGHQRGLTAAAFRPRGWRGALLPSDAEIHLEVLAGDKRPVTAAADHHEVADVREVIVTAEPERPMTLLFDRNHTLESRILAEQFR